ncbi:MAG: hypothetical protein F6K00_11045 [Leptolyngbya sp. SIOISBB]|nr:hypothetical protein [Leptolyngbya sp. SIOISBB]
MKSHSSHWFQVTTSPSQPQDRTQIPALPKWTVLIGCCLGGVIALPGQATTLATTATAETTIAQALPTPLPPLPTSGSAPATGEQYLVLVDGSSDLLLQQVRQVEPGAFVNYVDGRSVIQAGRFSSYQNAQYRADELAGLGVGAAVQTTDYASAPIAVTPPADYSLSYPVPQAGGQNLPAATVAATPSSIEFGQAVPFEPAAPTSAAAFPPPAPTTTYPSTPAAPTGTVAPPPVTTPAVIQNNLASGYYVVIPGNTVELQSIASQVVSLGAPSILVNTRTAPRGPHVAIGPYGDRDIAQEWNNYLRDSGINGARLHFE